jgi:hypothetical protein
MMLPAVSVSAAPVSLLPAVSVSAAPVSLLTPSLPARREHLLPVLPAKSTD